MDVVERAPLSTTGALKPEAREPRDGTIKGVSTYYLVGPNYFYFFIGVMCVMGLIYIVVAMRYKETTHVRA
jgi:hypothetical protein